jgi:hypothetical protein
MIAAPTFREVSSGFHGALRFARFDRGAMAWFDRGAEGAKRSFWAATICYPGFVVLLALHVAPADWARSGVAHILLVESIGYVFGWAAFPLAALAFCRWLGREREGIGFVAAYNWSQLLQTLLFVVVAAIAAFHLLPEGAADALSAISLLLVLIYEWFIARVAVGAGGAVAAVLVLIDLVLGAGLSRVTEGLY